MPTWMASTIFFEQSSIVFVRNHLLECECHLDLQADSSNNVCSKRMENEDTNWKKQTTQETYKYFSGIYSIIYNNKSNVQ